MPIYRDVKNVIKQIKNVKKRFLFRKNKKRYKKRINTMCGQWNSRLSINKPL